MHDIKIAIADDHYLIAEGISNMLRYHNRIEVIGTYQDGPSVLKGLAVIKPHILLLDILMPGMQGDELAQKIRKEYPDIKIIVLTSFDNIFHIKSMLQHNVEGYLLKHVKREELIEAISHVFNGGNYIDKEVKKILLEDARIIKRQKATRTMLTKRESEILQLIAQNNTSAEIAEKLFISKRTVEHHRESIFTKLDVKKASALLKKAIELNLLN